MLDIIIVEDDRICLNKTLKTVQSITGTLSNDFNLVVYASYNQKLKDYVNSTRVGSTIYIIDIYLKNVDKDSESGIDLINDIREVDVNSFLILISADSWLLNEAQKKRLNIYSYIHKEDSEIDALQMDVTRLLEHFQILDGFKFKADGLYYNFNYKDINYIQIVKNERKCMIKTKINSYVSRITLKSALEQLPPYFCRINKDTIINTKNIGKMSISDQIIEFKNGDVLNEEIASSKKKELKKLCKI